MTRRAFQITVGFMILIGWSVVGAYGIPSVQLEGLTNYPNPFDSRKMPTIIAYQLQNDSEVSIKMYDLYGTSVNEWRFYPGQDGARRGDNKFVWNGKNGRGDYVSAGGYLCQVVAQSGSTRIQGIRKIGVIH